MSTSAERALLLSGDEKRAAIECMRRMGGSFASSLAEAWMVADMTNQAKLIRAFPELLLQYDEMVKITKRRDMLIHRDPEIETRHMGPDR